MTDPDPSPAAPQPPSRAPLGPIAAMGLVLGLAAIAVGSITMVFGATGFFCPIVGLGLILIAQVGLAKMMGLSVRGPEVPMGVPPDELD